MYLPERGPSKFFCVDTDGRAAGYSNSRTPGDVRLSKIFTSVSGANPQLRRFITFGLERMSKTYLAATLGKEFVLGEEEAGRTEIRLLMTDDGWPCEFIIQRFDATKDGYEKIGVSLQSEDIERLLAAILVYRHYHKSGHRDKERGEFLNMGLLLERLENIALKQALEDYENGASARKL